MRQIVYQVCYTRYHVSFHLWLIGSVLKHCKVPKYYEQDCSFSGIGFSLLEVESRVSLPPNYCLPGGNFGDQNRISKRWNL